MVVRERQKEAGGRKGGITDEGLKLAQKMGLHPVASHRAFVH